MILRWRKIGFIQLLGINERHLGQREPIYPVALGMVTKISPEGSYLLQSGFHHLAFRMASSKVDSHRNPGQTRWLKNDSGRITIRENTLLKLLQTFHSTVEAEAIAGSCLLIQTTNLMTTGTAEVDTNTPDQCRLL
jgi:hypothetical protein